MLFEIFDLITILLMDYCSIYLSAIFGTWLIDGKGDLRFKKFGTREFVPVDKPDKYLRSNKPFTQIVTGYGNRVFAVINGELFKRDGVSFANPSGLSWKSTGVKGVRDTTNNNLGVFVILEDERMVKLEGKRFAMNFFTVILFI